MKKIYASIRHLALMLTILLLYNFPCKSQVPTKYYPKADLNVNGIYKTDKKPPVITIESINIAELLDEDDREASKGLPPRFGKDVNVNLNLNNSGIWSETSSGRVWKLSIEAKKAFSINLIFKHFYLDEGVEMFIYNEDQTMVIGPITSEMNNKDNVFATDLLAGSLITLELFEPFETKKNTKIHISKVIHGYKDIVSEEYFNGFGQSSPCNRDVVCPEGSIYSEVSNSVARVLVANGTRNCSGTLVNNACRNLTPNFLTAFHCLDLDLNGVLSAAEIDLTRNFVFRFRYKSPTCGGGDGTTFYTFSGSTLRASWFNTDFALLLLNSTPGPETGITYAGWTRELPNTRVVGIHHPRGDVMKISTSPRSPIAVTWEGIPGNIYWRTQFETGTVEPGSSGSGLFDRFSRLIGQLKGDQNVTGDYCGRRTGEYGRFDVSWTGGGTNNSRLSTWLTDDPNVQSVSTMGILHVDGPNVICTSSGSGRFSLRNTTGTGGTVTWTATNGLTVQYVAPYAYVSAPSSFNGYADVIATFRVGSCNPIEYRKRIRVNNPAPTVTTRDDRSSSYTYHYATAQLMSETTASNYRWYTEVNGQRGTLLTTGLNLSISVPPCSSMFYRLEVTNGCGIAVYRGVAYNSNCIYTYNTYPNPANEELVVESSISNFIEVDEHDDSEREIVKVADEEYVIYDDYNTFSVKLLDQFNKTLRSENTVTGKVNINLIGLKTGMYFLHLENKKEVKRSIIKIER